MSLLIKLDTAPTFEPKHAKPTAERLIAGDPSFKTWAFDESRSEPVRTGICTAVSAVVGIRRATRTRIGTTVRTVIRVGVANGVELVSGGLQPSVVGQGRIGHVRLLRQ